MISILSKVSLNLSFLDLKMPNEIYDNPSIIAKMNSPKKASPKGQSTASPVASEYVVGLVEELRAENVKLKAENAALNRAAQTVQGNAMPPSSKISFVKQKTFLNLNAFAKNVAKKGKNEVMLSNEGMLKMLIKR
ncbi:unnamed protein product [Meloidogyne enterolobii]|uniref:Uncharacterized protein n=1 Tax=Meloidogyne enterolobii TaxID=390850 RepID=A0ACB1AL88_MELEN